MRTLTFKKATKALGLKKIQALRVRRWAEQRGALLFDARGRLGSGVFIELSDGSEAILTAKHVVVDSAVTGEISAQRWGTLVRSVVPNEVWLHPNQDIAVVQCKALERTGKCVSRQEWIHAPPFPAVGESIQCSGAPGELKAKPDLLNRNIQTIQWLGFMTTVVQATPSSAIVDIDEMQSIPSEFRGMSGGPAINLRRELVGINVREARKLTPGTGQLTVTSLAMVRPFLDGLNRSSIELPECATQGFVAGYLIEAVAGPNKGLQVQLNVGYRRYFRPSASTSGEFEAKVRLVTAVLAPIDSESGIVMQLRKTATVDVLNEFEQVGNEALAALDMANYSLLVDVRPA